MFLQILCILTMSSLSQGSQMSPSSPLRQSRQPKSSGYATSHAALHSQGSSGSYNQPIEGAYHASWGAGSYPASSGVGGQGSTQLGHYSNLADKSKTHGSVKGGWKGYNYVRPVVMQQPLIQVPIVHVRPQPPAMPSYQPLTTYARPSPNTITVSYGSVRPTYIQQSAPQWIHPTSNNLQYFHSDPVPAKPISLPYYAYFQQRPAQPLAPQVTSVQSPSFSPQEQVSYGRPYHIVPQVTYAQAAPSVSPQTQGSYGYGRPSPALVQRPIFSAIPVSESQGIGTDGFSGSYTEGGSQVEYPGETNGNVVLSPLPVGGSDSSGSIQGNGLTDLPPPPAYG